MDYWGLFPGVPVMCDSSDRCEAPVGLYGNRRDLMVTGKRLAHRCSRDKGI